MTVIADLLVQVGADIAGLDSGLKTAEASLKNFSQDMTAAGTGMIELGAPLTALGVIAAKTAGDFEASMNVLSVAVGDSGASLEDLRSVALQAGSDVNLVGVSASDVALAMTNMTKAGISTSDMLGNMQGYLDGTAQMGGALRAAIDLAAASELDLDQASQLVVTTMSTFGLSADEVVGAMNNYVQSADASVASVGDLALAMQNIGPTMAAFGFSLEDTNTALAILSTRGITGAEAGTALKAMLTNLMRPTEDVTTALANMNVALYDQAGNMRPLPDILADLERGLIGMTEEQRNAVIQILAGSYGQKAMNTLLAEGSVGWNEMETAIGDAATMQESAAAQTRGFNAAIENLKSSVETFLINVGTPLINDVLTPMVQKFTEIVGGLAKVNPAFLEFAIVAGGILTVLGTVFVIVGQVAGAFSALAGLFAAGGAMAGVGTAIAALAGPIAAIMAVVAGLYVAWQDDFLAMQTIVQGLELTFMAVTGTLKKIWGDFGAFLRGDKTWAEFIASTEASFGTLIDVLDQVWKAIGSQVASAWESVKVTISEKLKGVEYDVMMGAAKILEIFGMSQDNALAIVIVKWGEIKDEFNQAFTDIKAYWEGTLEPAFQDFVAWMRDSLVPAVKDFAGWVRDSVLPAIRDMATWLDQNLVPAIKDVATWLDQNLVPAIDDVAGWIVNSLVPAVRDIAGWFANSFLPALRDVYNFITQYIVPVFAGVANVLDSVLGLALKAAQGLWQNVLLPALKDVWTFIYVYLKPIFDNLGKDLGETGAVGKAIAFIKDLFVKLGLAMPGIKDALSGIAGWFGTLATKIDLLKLPDWLTPGSPTPLETALLGILEALKNVATGPWEWFNNLLSLFGLGGGSGSAGGGMTISVLVGPGAVVVYGEDPTGTAKTVGNAIAATLKALTQAENKVGVGAGWVMP